MGGRLGWVAAVLAALAVFAAAVTWVAKARTAQERLYCVNNLRTLSQFADLHDKLNPGRPLFTAERPRRTLTADEKAKLQRDAGPQTVPPATVFNPALPPDRRLSWVVHLLPALGGRQDTKSLSDAIDRSAPWDDPRHAGLSRAPLEALRCYGKTPNVPFDSPAVTQFVASGGVGADAPGLPWPDELKPHPRSGAFRHDSPTPLAAFLDGTSGSVLFAETDRALGPWLRGGPATLRTLDGTPPVGPGGQFGGTHPGGGNFAFADTSVRFLSDRTSAEVLHALMTIAGGTDDPVPGD
jgi:prepilin-type processing-associated H-X9-DG protein